MLQRENGKTRGLSGYAVSAQKRTHITIGNIAMDGTTTVQRMDELENDLRTVFYRGVAVGFVFGALTTAIVVILARLAQ